MSEQKKRRLHARDGEYVSARGASGEPEPREESRNDESEEEDTKDVPIRILPLWAWGVVMIISFLIALWIVSTYFLGSS